MCTRGIGDGFRTGIVGTPVVSELYKHVIYISHANEEGYWGTNPGRDPRQVMQRTTPLNARLGAWVYWGYQSQAGTDRRQAVPSTSDTTTRWTPWSNHNQVCTTMNREPALLPCTSYHTRIMHGEGVGTADSTTTTLDTKANITTRIRVKIQNNPHRGHWPIITSHSGSQHKLFYTARSKRTKSP